MDIQSTFARWKEQAVDDPDLISELSGLQDEKEIFERFYRDLEFGTGGLRGVIGAGTNRMNIYVIRRVPNSSTRASTATLARAATTTFGQLQAACLDHRGDRLGSGEAGAVCPGHRRDAAHARS